MFSSLSSYLFSSFSWFPSSGFEPLPPWQVTGGGVWAISLYDHSIESSWILREEMKSIKISDMKTSYNTRRWRLWTHDHIHWDKRERETEYSLRLILHSSFSLHFNQSSTSLQTILRPKNFEKHNLTIHKGKVIIKRIPCSLSCMQFDCPSRLFPLVLVD